MPESLIVSENRCKQSAGYNRAQQDLLSGPHVHNIYAVASGPLHPKFMIKAESALLYNIKAQP